MSDLKPCPNPECKSTNTGLTASLADPTAILGDPTQVNHYGRCRQCGMTGPRKRHAATAFEFWNALPREPEWTETPPSVPGWYFMRRGDGKVFMIEIDDVGLTLRRQSPLIAYAGPFRIPPMPPEPS